MAVEQEGAGIRRNAKVIIVGGGLAGLSAALPLAQAGLQVKVLERSNFLGGRAGSVPNKRLGIPLDRGQHVLLGCCTNLVDFYHRVGAADHIRFVDSIQFASHQGRSILRRSRLPEPLTLLPSLARLRAMSIRDKLSAVKLLKQATSPICADMSAAEWLAQAGQSKPAIAHFWEPILTGALNDTLDRASARYAALVVRQAMLLNRDGFPLGLPMVPLSEIHDRLPRQALGRAGAAISTGTNVSNIRTGNDAVFANMADGATHKADYCVVAASPMQDSLLPPDTAICAGPGDPVLRSEQVPIITLHLWYNSILKTRDSGLRTMRGCLCIPGPIFHWVFDKSDCEPRMSGMATSIAMVASAAREGIQLAPEQLLQTGLKELGSALNADIPTPDLWEVVKSCNATFSPTVSCDRIRPSQKTRIPNLFLAGDWTDTGWPGTMESAVRSGYICAREILAAEGLGCEIPVRDLRARGLARLLPSP